MIEKEKLKLKKRKVDLMEQMVTLMERNTKAVSDIRDFLIVNKQNMFMAMDSPVTEV